MFKHQYRIDIIVKYTYNTYNKFIDAASKLSSHARTGAPDRLRSGPLPRQARLRTHGRVRNWDSELGRTALTKLRADFTFSITYYAPQSVQNAVLTAQ